MIIHLIVYTCNHQLLQSDIVSLSGSLNKKFDFITGNKSAVMDCFADSIVCM